MTKREELENIITERQERFMNMNEDELREHAALWYPGGSGSYSAMFECSALLRVVATLRGMDITKVK